LENRQITLCGIACNSGVSVEQVLFKKVCAWWMGPRNVNVRQKGSVCMPNVCASLNWKETQS
jgi:hypothetical protein